MKFLRKSTKTDEPSNEVESPVETVTEEPVPENENESLQAEDLVEADDDDGSVEMDIEAYNAVKKVDEKSAKKMKASEESSVETKEHEVKKWWIVVVLLLFTVAGVVLALALTLPKDKKEEVEESAVPTSAPTIVPTTAIEGVLYGILEAYTLKEVLADASTPQGKAFNQLLSEVTTIDAIDKFRVEQRYALMTVYFSTAGEGWNNRVGWSTFSENECDWFGVSTCRRDADGNSAVTNLNLNGNKLQGTLPFEICALHSELGELHLGENDISDEIPWCLVGFRQMKILELSNLQLTGEVPGLLTNPSLKELSLKNNQLTGSLEKLFELPEALTGSLAEVGEETNILSTAAISLQLQGNSFDGQIPKDFGKLGELTSLELHSNDLTGDMAPEICELKNFGVLVELTADCVKDISCGCCSYCHVREE